MKQLPASLVFIHFTIAIQEVNFQKAGFSFKLHCSSRINFQQTAVVFRLEV